VGDFAVYQRMLRAQVRSQVAYRTSFVLNCVSQALAQAGDLLVIVVVFGQVASLGGFSAPEVMLIYALSGLGFGLADLCIGSIEQLPTYIRSGKFDVVLMRPLGTLAQIAVGDLQLRRLGRVATSVGVLAYVLSTMDLQWSAAKVALVAVTPLAGAVIFGSIFVVANSVCFWMVEARELANTVTYGGNYFTAYPITVFSGWLRGLLAYAVPGAFVAYYPTLALLGRPDPLGAPQWLCWGGPVVAVLAASVTGLVWRYAVRHYRGTGS
jgi:ABC-2 type transport system permease protein